MDRRRSSLRHAGWDYGSDGWYFVTIVVHDRVRCLSQIADDAEVLLTSIGRIVEDELLKTPMIRSYVQLDEYVIMPDHLHIILVINRGDAVQDDQRHWKPGCLGAIISRFKEACTKRIRREIDADFQWHRNYNDRVIRDEDELKRIREYIQNNPARWIEDQNT